MRRALLLVLMLAGCEGERQPSPPAASAGAALEDAATASGIVSDPRAASLTGSWGRDNDRACIVPAERATVRLGVLLDYGEGQGCAASGSAERDGGRFRVRLGACRFDARFDGDRISFPAEVPAACARLCTGRATLAAVTLDRISSSQSEAETLRAPGGQKLCTS